jgi:CheY-like chemotaxis protein
LVIGHWCRVVHESFVNDLNEESVMTVTCPKCRVALNVPHDRLPKGKAVNAACPKCGGSVVIGTTGPSMPPEAVAPPAPASYGDRRRQPALVCVPDPAERQQVLAALDDAGYAAHVAAGPAEALERLRFTAYAVAVVREGFDGPAVTASSVCEALAETPMGTRRNTHTVFVGPSVTSHDVAAAFAKSVDLTIHPHDLPHFSEALKRSLAETEQLYRTFRDAQRALGKE